MMTEDNTENQTLEVENNEATIAQELCDAVNLLDDSNDEHWNKAGEPNINQLQIQLERNRITRKEVEAVSDRKRVIEDVATPVKAQGQALPNQADKSFSSPDLAGGANTPPATFSGDYKLLVNLSHDNQDYKIDALIGKDDFDEATLQGWFNKGYIEAIV